MVVRVVARGFGGRQTSDGQQQTRVHLVHQVRGVLARAPGEGLRQVARLLRGAQVRVRIGRTG